jgi:hypothetical protein
MKKIIGLVFGFLLVGCVPAGYYGPYGDIRVSSPVGGVEVYEGYHRDELIIRSSLGGHSPAYKQGVRVAKRRERQESRWYERSMIADKAVYDARRGVFAPSGFNLKYYPQYEEIFERERQHLRRSEQRMYERMEYRRGYYEYRHRP